MEDNKRSMKAKDEIGFINGVSETEVIAALRSMKNSAVYLTKPNYRGVSVRWTNNYTSFVDYHINYLKLHPTLKPEQYISNLRLTLRKTPRHS